MLVKETQKLVEDILELIKNENEFFPLTVSSTIQLIRDLNKCSKDKAVRLIDLLVNDVGIFYECKSNDGMEECIGWSG
jgi:hypothetical protein